MSSLFYIWDANEHHPEVKITTLEQAEYYATHAQVTGLTDKLKNWLLAVESIVGQSELAANFDEEIISSFTNVKAYFDYSENVFCIEQGLLAKSKYLYKVLVETLRQHDLVAFDARSYIFFSHEKIFPDQQSIEQMLDAVKSVTKEELEQFKAIPPTREKLSIFADQWLELNKQTLNFSRQIKNNQFNQLNSYFRDFDLQLYEGILILCSDKTEVLAYHDISLLTYIQVSSKKAIRIPREHKIDGYTLQYLPEVHGITGEPSHFSEPSQLKHVLDQMHDFLIYDAKKHQDIETLNQWLNHGDEKEYITGLGAISRLVLAKYVNDPLYDQLVSEAMPYVNRHRYFKDMTVEQFHERLEQEIQNILES
ncbi:hypothetical protein [uncultured Acinetobacter sp.]|uniref:hypothetical protein n=1 Tax=uncultured Acinetobacter sp. TaxID=165433 RepID=UPI002586CD15|nr:hypothetical protein [uncultured Acinetobacter sp.]